MVNTILVGFVAAVSPVGTTVKVVSVVASSVVYPVPDLVPVSPLVTPDIVAAPEAGLLANAVDAVIANTKLTSFGTVQALPEFANVTVNILPSESVAAVASQFVPLVVIDTA